MAPPSAGRYRSGFQPHATLASHRVGVTHVWTGMLAAGDAFHTLVTEPGRKATLAAASEDRTTAMVNHLSACSIELALLGDGTVNDLGEQVRAGLPESWALAALDALLRAVP